MKHLFNILSKLTAVAAVGLSISSCNRAEYAMLPKTTSYHGTERVAARPPAQPASASESVATSEVESPSVAPITEVAAVPVVVTPAKNSSVIATTQTPLAVSPKSSARQITATPKKNSLVQKLAVAKMAKKVEKVTSKMQLKKHSEVAATSRLEGKLRQGLILILVSLLVGLLANIGGFVGSVFAVVAGVLFIIGVVLIILYLLDEV